MDDKVEVTITTETIETTETTEEVRSDIEPEKKIITEKDLETIEIPMGREYDPERNYLKEFFSSDADKREETYKSFFNINSDTDPILTSITKKVDKIRKQLEEENNKLQKVYSLRYEQQYVQKETPSYLCYNGRSGTFYYTFPDGIAVKEPTKEEIAATKASIYPVSYKTGHIEIVKGYSYNTGSIICGRYQYKVSSDNKSIKLIPTREFGYSLLDDKYYDSTGAVYKDSGIMYMHRTLELENGNEFINKLFKTSVDLNMTLQDYAYAYKNNCNFEMIIKVVPDELKKSLLQVHTAIKQTPYEMVGVSKEAYNRAIAEKVIVEVYNLREYIANKDKFPYTDNQWLDLIHKGVEYTKDLTFYSIGYGRYSWERASTTPGKLLCTLAESYCSNTVLSHNYSFGKFVNYVVTESINQGYSDISTYVMQLRDYLNMCATRGIKPSLYTDTLKITHDIATRNLSIFVSPEEERIFSARYDSFTNYKHKDYHILAPSKSEELKFEGNALNHCVSAYIKKVIDGDSLILFLRKDPVIPLITLQLKNNKIIQARGMHNRNPYAEEIEIIEKFAKDRGLEIDY